MSIIKETLHPTGYDNVDLYPKTSVDQVEGLDERVGEITADYVLQNYGENGTCPFAIGMYVYLNSDTNPASIYPNTGWVRITGRFLYGCSDNEIGTEGGYADPILIIHQHRVSTIVSKSGYGSDNLANYSRNGEKLDTIYVSNPPINETSLIPGVEIIKTGSSEGTISNAKYTHIGTTSRPTDNSWYDLDGIEYANVAGNKYNYPPFLGAALWYRVD